MRTSDNRSTSTSQASLMALSMLEGYGEKSWVLAYEAGIPVIASHSSHCLAFQSLPRIPVIA
jgi:hypothetical protein